MTPISFTAIMICFFFFSGFYAFIVSLKKQKIKQNEKSLKVLYALYMLALFSLLLYISAPFKLIEDEKYKYIVLVLLFVLQLCFAISILSVYKGNKENKGRIASFVFIILNIILTIIILRLFWKNEDVWTFNNWST